jgi:dTDP-4-dehydrorhamnose 3,5-epimerase-like enzyme
MTDRNHLSVLIPPGFVNGHLCLSEECLFHYAQSYPTTYVDVNEQDVLKWNDVRLDIDWPTGVKPILSERDR